MRGFAVALIGLLFLSVAVEEVLATTVGVESARVPLGSAVEVPITLNIASNGLSEFAITVSLADGGVADIERVELPAAFNKAATVEIAPDRDSVTISASDADDLIKPGAHKIELARVVFRGTFRGHSAVQVAIGRLIDDSGNSIVSTTSEGELEVTGGPTMGVATVVAGSDGARVNETVATPIILTQAPNGLSGYQLTVRLERGEIAQIEGVEFVAFAGNAQVEVAQDGNSVRFSADDLEDRVRPGAVGIVLAWVLFKGVLPGSSAIEVQINRVTDENGLSAASATVPGRLTVSGLLDLPPSFSNEQPHDRSTIQINQPTISVKISDDNDDVAPETIRMEVTDTSGTMSFDRGSPGALWDGRTFSVNLREAGVTLADGEVTVEVSAADKGGHLGRFSWSFTVSVGTNGGGRTIAQAIAALVPGDPPGVADPDTIIGDQEILKAVEYWISGLPVPGTGGQIIDDAMILKLIQLWIAGEPIGTSMEMSYRGNEGQ